MIRRSAEVPSAPLEADLLLMSLDLGKYFVLNGVGRRIWDILEFPTRPDIIVRELIEEYDVPPDTCAAQVDEFLKKLRERELLADVD